MRRSRFAEYQIDSITVFFEDGRYRLVDNDTGESSIDKSIEKAYNALIKKIEEFKKQPQEAENEKKKRAAKLILDMAKDEFFMSALLVGLISSDNNRTESEIKRNLDHFKWLQSGLEYAEPKNDKQKSRIKKIAEYITQGIETLERDEIKVPARDRLVNLLGWETMSKMRKLYDSYFDPHTVSTESRDRYIAERFGECEEPTYDHLWNVWYLGHKREDGTVDYLIGSAIDILGEFLDCRVTTQCSSYNRLGMKSMSTGGTLDDVFREAWNERIEGYSFKLDDNDFLSSKQQELWDKVREYAEANPK